MSTIKTSMPVVFIYMNKEYYGDHFTPNNEEIEKAIIAMLDREKIEYTQN